MKLIIAEKPSMAQAIARALNISEKKNGYLQNDEYIITWCIGYLAGLADAAAYDEKYGKWNYEDLPIIPRDWQYTLNEGKKAQFDIVKRLMFRDDVTELVNACDAGREGELIFRFVYNMAGCNKPFKRLWISSLEDTSIREGFNNLRNGSEYDNLLFLSDVRKYARARKLTPRMLNELIEKIEVYQAERINGEKIQKIKIHYNCIVLLIFPA